MKEETLPQRKNVIRLGDNKVLGYYYGIVTRLDDILECGPVGGCLLVHESLQHFLGQVLLEEGLALGVLVHLGKAVLQVTDDVIADTVVVATTTTRGVISEKRKKIREITSMSAAGVRMEIPFLVRSMKSGIMNSNSFQLDNTFSVLVSTTAEQLRCRADIVEQ